MHPLISSLIATTTFSFHYTERCDQGYIASYNITSHEILLCEELPREQYVKAIYHELWHHFYNTMVTEQEKELWLKLDSAYDDRMDHYRRYSMTSPEEDFADMFSLQFHTDEFFDEHVRYTLSRGFHIKSKVLKAYIERHSTEQISE